MSDDPVSPRASVLETLLQRARSSAGAREATRHRRGDKVVSTSWSEWARRSRTFAAGLVASGIEPGDRVAILSHTRVEWVWLDVAVAMAGAVSVPIFPTEVASGCATQLADCGAKAILVEDPSQAAKVATVRADLPALTAAWFLERRAIAPGGALVLIEDLADAGAFFRPLDELQELGEQSLDAVRDELDRRTAAARGDVDATIHYTAGTEGTPKGVRLTHRGFSLTSDALAERLPLDPTDVQLLYLPLAQPFARLCLAVAVQVGFVTCFARSYKTVLEDAQVFRPTFVCGVPRLFEGIRKRLTGDQRRMPTVPRTASEVAQALAKRATEETEPGLVARLRRAVAERLVFSPTREIFGGAIRFAISGGAPLTQETGQFFRERGLEILEGYGMTETCACTHLNDLGDNRLGSVGQALPFVETRVDDDGEIHVRAPTVTPGYWGRPDATALVLAEDGWLRTGDLGVIDPDGFLRITDRKRDVIITANGKAIAPQGIAAALEAEPLIDKVLIHGDRRDYLTALVTLDRDELALFADEQGLDDGGSGFEGLARHPVVYELVDGVVARVNAGLPRHENVRKFAILGAELTEEDGELTPTRRVRRKVASERHRALLDSFYSERY